jgi:hypothetical protein
MDYRAKLDEVIATMGVQIGEGGLLPEVDSLEVMNLVSQLEEAVGMMIPGDELVPENFKTLDDIVALLNRISKSSGANSGATT